MDIQQSLGNGCHIYGFQKPGQSLFDFEIITLRLSVIEWKKHNQKMFLVCNQYFLDYAKETGLIELYDEYKLVEVPESVNQEVFWAAIKIYAYDQYPCGTTFIDIDASLNDAVINYIKPTTRILTAHFDDAKGELENLVYPEGYTRQPWMRERNTFEGLNMCLVCFLDEEIRYEYLQEAKFFMEGNPAQPSDNYSNYGMMVFAEQSLIMDICKHRSAHPDFVMPEFPMDNPPMRHTWRAKCMLKQIQSLRNNYISKVEKLINLQNNT